MDKELHVLFVSDHGSWTAVGLEHAVFAWGDNMEQTIDRFIENLWLELVQSVERDEPYLSTIPKAPPRYQDLAKAARKLAEPIVFVPPPQIKDLPPVSSETIPKLVGHIAA